LDLRSETELQIQVEEHQFDYVYLSKVVEDRKSWFTQMEVLDLIYHQIFFTTNSLRRQPRTSQYFQPLTSQSLTPAVAAIHCALSEYASGQQATVMISQEEYQGTFYPSPVINFTTEATGLVNDTVVGRLIPPEVQLGKERHSLSPVGSPSPRLMPVSFIPHSVSLSALLNFHRPSLSQMDSGLMHSALNSPVHVPQIPSVLLSQD
jgi:hypothetical protein